MMKQVKVKAGELRELQSLHLHLKIKNGSWLRKGYVGNRSEL